MIVTNPSLVSIRPLLVPSYVYTWRTRPTFGTLLSLYRETLGGGYRCVRLTGLWYLVVGVPEVTLSGHRDLVLVPPDDRW